MTTWEKIKYEYNKGGSAIRQIIMVNLAVFIFTIFVGVIATLMVADQDVFLSYFYLQSDFGTLLVRPWTLITNIFFHAGFMHILGNMLILFFIGRILQDFLSSKQVWRIFFLGALSGVGLYLLSYNIFPVFSSTLGEIKGASGGVTAILVATGVFLPYYSIRPFGLFNIEMRWVALIFVFRDLYTFQEMHNLGGLLAHLGGAMFGALYILNLQGKINIPTIDLDRFVPKKRPMKVVDETKVHKQRVNKKTKPQQEEIDAILDKISQSGYDSLSADEKNTLFKAGE